MNKLLKTLIILSCALLSGLFSVNAGSIATVDVQKVLSEYVEFNQAVEKVRAAVAPIEEEIAKMQEEVTNIIAEAREADARSNNPALEESARDEARSKIIELQIATIYATSPRARSKWTAERSDTTPRSRTRSGSRDF